MTLPEPENFELTKQNLAKLYALGEARHINPERWLRARELLFSDVVEEVTGKTGQSISCPFHGRDSRPSFYVYPPSRGNCGYCFGCPPKQNCYDSITLVSRYFSFNRVKALIWLEKKWNLPPIDDIIEEKEEENTVELVLKDVKEPFISLVKRDIQETQDVVLAKEYLNLYFEAEKGGNILPLAQILGREQVKKLLFKKAYLS